MTITNSRLATSSADPDLSRFPLASIPRHLTFRLSRPSCPVRVRAGWRGWIRCGHARTLVWDADQTGDPQAPPEALRA
jgi:hypothetical protein